MRVPLVLVGLALVGCIAGCGAKPQPVASVGRVGIIDLDVVANRLGRDSEMETVLNDQQKSISEKLSAAKADLEQQIFAKQEELANLDAIKQAKILVALQEQANTHLVGFQRQAASVIDQSSRLMVKRFREETSIAAKRVAKKHGLSIVVTKNDNVILAFDDSVDITDEVVELMHAQARRIPVADADSGSPTEAPELTSVMEVGS